MSEWNINRGALRHRVRIEENLGAGTYSGGERSDNWQSVAGSSCVACSIRQLSGAELERARMIVNEATDEVIMSYRKGVNTQQRLAWVTGEGSTRILNIANVNNVAGVNRKLVLTCVTETTT